MRIANGKSRFALRENGHAADPELLASCGLVDKAIHLERTRESLLVFVEGDRSQVGQGDVVLSAVVFVNLVCEHRAHKVRVCEEGDQHPQNWRFEIVMLDELGDTLFGLLSDGP